MGQLIRLMPDPSPTPFNGITMCTQNRTVSWLDNLDEERRAQVFTLYILFE